MGCRGGGVKLLWEIEIGHNNFGLVAFNWETHISEIRFGLINGNSIFRMFFWFIFIWLLILPNYPVPYCSFRGINLQQLEWTQQVPLSRTGSHSWSQVHSTAAQSRCRGDGVGLKPDALCPVPQPALHLFLEASPVFPKSPPLNADWPCTIHT